MEESEKERRVLEGRASALEKEKKGVHKEMADAKREWGNEKERNAIALGKAEGGLKSEKEEKERLRRSLKEKDAEVGRLQADIASARAANASSGTEATDMRKRLADLEAAMRRAREEHEAALASELEAAKEAAREAAAAIDAVRADGAAALEGARRAAEAERAAAAGAAARAKEEALRLQAEELRKAEAERLGALKAEQAQLAQQVAAEALAAAPLHPCPPRTLPP